MLTILLTLGVMTFVVSPLVLWGSAKVVRIKGVGIGRAYAVYTVLAVVGLTGLVLALAANIRPPAALVLCIGLLFPQVLVVKAAFRAGWVRVIGCLLLVIVVNFVLAFGIRAVAVEAFVVSAGGMQPTLIPGDRVLAEKLSPRLRPPARGEVVFFHPPHDLRTTFVQRVLAVEGDKLTASGDDLLVNGKSLGNCHLRDVREMPHMHPLELPTVVPPGKLLLLGDNRDESLDSRFWGFADANQVIGRAVIIYASATPPPDPDRRRPSDEQFGPPEPPRWRRIGKVIR